MSYGLSKLLKNLLPKRLFYRALLIVAVPIISFTTSNYNSVVFFDSLWIKTNKGMTRALVGEIKHLLEAYDNNDNMTNNDLIIGLLFNLSRFKCKIEEKNFKKKSKKKDGSVQLIEL